MFSPVVALKRIAKLQFFPAKYHFSWLSVLWVRSSQCFRLLAYSFDRRRSCMDAWRRRSFRRIFSNPRPGCNFFSKVCCPRWGMLQRHLLPTKKDEDTMRINWMLITWSFRVFTTPFLYLFKQFKVFLAIYIAFMYCRQTKRWIGRKRREREWCQSCLMHFGVMFVPTTPPFYELHQFSWSFFGWRISENEGCSASSKTKQKQWNETR